MDKTYTKEEFTELLTDVLTSLIDQADKRECKNASTGIMLTGILIISEIKTKIFDDDTNTITIIKE